MNRYDILLVELLRRLDEKADKLIQLLEVSERTKYSSNDRREPSDNSPDRA